MDPVSLNGRIRIFLEDLTRIRVTPCVQQPWRGLLHEGSDEERLKIKSVLNIIKVKWIIFPFCGI